jgi:hypothetical protein
MGRKAGFAHFLGEGGGISKLLLYLHVVVKAATGDGRRLLFNQPETAQFANNTKKDR